MHTTTTPNHVGTMLRTLRTARGMSQLALSLEAGVSSRHLSFIETGRSIPSREMVIALAETLEVPLRDRNLLLEAAGYASIYRETPLEAPVMADIRGALAHILEASAPNPTLVVNRRYDVILANEAAKRVLGFFARDYRGKNNVVHMLLAEEGLRRHVENWAEVTTHVVRRTRTELAASKSRDAEDEALLRTLISVEPELRHAKGTRPPAILIPLVLRRDDVRLELFTTITTLGTPLDITLQELRIETLFSANAQAREALLALVVT